MAMANSEKSVFLSRVFPKRMENFYHGLSHLPMIVSFAALAVTTSKGNFVALRDGLQLGAFFGNMPETHQR